MYQRWKIGTVVQATTVLVDWDHKGEPYIKAVPGEFGIVFTDCNNGDEVKFRSGCFTSFEGDGVVMYNGEVTMIVDPPNDEDGHGVRPYIVRKR